MGVGGQRHAPAVLPLGLTRYLLYRRLGRPQGRSGRVLKISPTPGLDPRTVQLVASPYTDCAIPAHSCPQILKLISIEHYQRVFTAEVWVSQTEVPIKTFTDPED
jgi:hypothetical protein